MDPESGKLRLFIKKDLQSGKWITSNDCPIDNKIILKKTGRYMQVMKSKQTKCDKELDTVAMSALKQDVEDVRHNNTIEFVDMATSKKIVALDVNGNLPVKEKISLDTNKSNLDSQSCVSPTFQRKQGRQHSKLKYRLPECIPTYVTQYSPMVDAGKTGLTAEVNQTTAETRNTSRGLIGTIKEYVDSQSVKTDADLEIINQATIQADKANIEMNDTAYKQLSNYSSLDGNNNTFLEEEKHLPAIEQFSTIDLRDLGISYCTSTSVVKAPAKFSSEASVSGIQDDACFGHPSQNNAITEKDVCMALVREGTGNEHYVLEIEDTETAVQSYDSNSYLIEVHVVNNKEPCSIEDQLMLQNILALNNNSLSQEESFEMPSSSVNENPTFDFLNSSAENEDCIYDVSVITSVDESPHDVNVGCMDCSGLDHAEGIDRYEINTKQQENHQQGNKFKKGVADSMSGSDEEIEPGRLKIVEDEEIDEKSEQKKRKHCFKRKAKMSEVSADNKEKTLLNKENTQKAKKIQKKIQYRRGPSKKKRNTLCTKLERDDPVRKWMLQDLKAGHYGDKPHVIRVTKDGTIINVSEEYKEYLPYNMNSACDPN